MTKFTIDVTDSRLLAGLTAARDAGNAEMPPVLDPDTNEPIEPNPNLVATDVAYLTARVGEVLESYARQHVDDQDKERFLAKLPEGKRAAVDAAIAAELGK